MTLYREGETPLSYRADESALASPALAGPATRDGFEMFGVPQYARLQIPLRMGADYGTSTLAHWPEYAAELRKLAAEIDRLYAENRTNELLRTRRLLNTARHTNHQMAVDSPRKQK